MKFLKYWLPVALWMVVIFFMSTDFGSAEHSSRLIEPLVRWIKPDVTVDQLGVVHFIVRKLGHLSEYAVLALLTLRAFTHTLRAPLNRCCWQTAGLTLLVIVPYAATDEWHQTLVPGRTPAVGDVMIDATGGLLALVVALSWSYFLPSRIRPQTQKA
ncbi:MAG: VanZ family protein [Nibricoccus sp.]